MELEQQGLRLSLVLGNASVLKCTALALTATVVSSLLELFAQVAVLKGGDVLENGYEVVDAVEGNGNNNDDGGDDDDGEDEEGGADDAEGKETKKGPVSDPDLNGEAGDDDDDEPEGDDGNDDDDDDDDENHENDEDDEDDEDENEDGGEDDEMRRQR
ncbi:PREDICTED: phosphopantothenoylcysteine decarboxylase subunit VHS3-like [Camelina sativa]|uniref:Phosphopantothenoylcysteine decarboxylase subunit VHS3-like n=1 Tax=Camelina sativa TaxID=90675 RepID=A0ABM1QE91_CAMSA|nr:PREDICTED: phosphopantothenoylcysteine decarboxylase subunit VHS3-like [Camelina sativa]XP_019085080.1 PREDICTED: phosphopantothenoylcysteine decarboxylase subunit VHS3-like [Camelina sativa]